MQAEKVPHGPEADEIEQVEAIVDAMRDGQTVTPAMREKVAAYYASAGHGSTTEPSQDVNAILERIVAMTDEEAVDILVEAISAHKVLAPQTTSGLMSMSLT